MDKLARMQQADLRSYVRAIREQCMPRRFALASGNSLANYIPVQNYLAMVDEAAAGPVDAFAAWPLATAVLE